MGSRLFAASGKKPSLPLANLPFAKLRGNSEITWARVFVAKATKPRFS
jgi:hypothetical protein